MVIASLRQATTELHRGVESRVDFLSPSLDIARYTRILQAFYAFFAPMEAAMEAQCPAELSQLWRGRRRAHLIANDLEALGTAPNATPGAPFQVPDVSSAGRWLGGLYVLEGSTLGGQVISRQVEKQFGWRQGQGYSFFVAHGSATRERWRQVTEMLEQHSAQVDLITAGARDAFAQLDHILAAYL